MDKSGDIIKIKVLISGKTKSYTIDINKFMNISDLSTILCQTFTLQKNNIKIILNNKPIEKFKDQNINSILSRDKKPYIIIYFNENESKFFLKLNLISEILQDKNNSESISQIKNKNITNRSNSKDIYNFRNSIIDNMKNSIMSNNSRLNKDNSLKDLRKSVLNKSTDSRNTTIGRKSTSSLSNTIINNYQKNKSKNISPRELERKKYIFNKEIENIDKELKKFNELDINECYYFNENKNIEINNIHYQIEIFEKEFLKISEKINKIKDFITKNLIIKTENYNNFKIQNENTLLLLKQKIIFYNKNLSKCKKIFFILVNNTYTDLFDNFDLENFDELNNIKISSNIYKIFESIYERKKEYDEIKSNIKEINTSIHEISYQPEIQIDRINDKLNKIYLELTSNTVQGLSKQDSIDDISTIRMENLENLENNEKANYFSNKSHENNQENITNKFQNIINRKNINEKNFINYESNNNIQKNFNELILAEKNTNNNNVFNTIKSNNKNTLNLNEDSQLYLNNKILYTNKKSDDNKNLFDIISNNDSENKKIKVINSGNNNNNNFTNNIHSTEEHNNLNTNKNFFNQNLQDNINKNSNNTNILHEQIITNQSLLKRTLNNANFTLKPNKEKYDNPDLRYENIIKNIPSQIKKIEENYSVQNNNNNNYTTTANNNIASSNGFMSNKNNQNNSTKEDINYETFNNKIENFSNPENLNNYNTNPLEKSSSKQLQQNNLLVSLKENSNILFSYNPKKKEKLNHEIIFPLDSKEKKFYWNCRLLQNDSDIFITGGHDENNNPSKKCYYLNSNIIDSFDNLNKPINIIELKQMNFSSWGHSMILLENKFLFTISGYNKKKCEYLDIQSDKWKNLSELNIWRMDCNLFLYNNSYIYAFGGFNDNNKFNKPFVKKIEKLKIFNRGIDVPTNVNKWEFVNLFEEKGEYNIYSLIPCMGMITLSDNKLLLFGGDTSDYSNFNEEITTNRSNYQNGHLAENNSSFNKLNKVEYHNKIFLIKINILGNCEIEELSFKLYKPTCFTTAKQFILYDNCFMGFDQNLEVCEIENNFQMK